VRPAVIIPAIAVIAAAVWWTTRSSSPSTANAGAVERTVAVTSGPMRQTVSASGTLQPANSQNLNFATSGQVTAVNVKAGQQVAKGAVLATVDSAALQSQVAQAQATVDAAAARVSSDQSSAVSSAQLSSDQASLTAAQAQLASAQAALSGASITAPMDGTIAVVNLTVGQQLSGTGTSGNNISGTGTGSGRTSGGTNSSGSGGGGNGGNGASGNNSSSSNSTTPQIQLVSTGSFVVNLGVDDTQIGRIKVGQAATITPSNNPTSGAGGGRGRFFFGQGGTGVQNAEPTTPTTSGSDALGSLSQAPTTSATGTVTSVGAIATSTSGVASFPVVVSVDGSPSGFFAGSTAQVAITYNQLDNVLQVPSLAITRANGQEFVTATENGKRTQRAVTTGLVAGGQTQITGGLTRGELVVVTVPGRIAGGNGNGNGANRNATNGNRGFNGGGGPPGGGTFIGGRD